MPAEFSGTPGGADNNMGTKTTELMPISIAARALGYSAEWLRALADAGKIPCIRDALGRRLFDARVVQKVLRERTPNRDDQQAAR